MPEIRWNANSDPRDRDSQILLNGQPDFGMESLREGGDRAAGLVDNDALHSMHGEKYGIQADRRFLPLNDLADKVVEDVEFDSPHGDAL